MAEPPAGRSNANSEVPRIAPAEAEALMRDGRAVLIDVREREELAASGKVPGAIHIPNGEVASRADPRGPTHDKAFDRSKTIILYCASGGRSGMAAKLLKAMGYPDVRNMGGLRDWAESGRAVEPA